MIGVGMRMTLDEAVAKARIAGYARRFPPHDDPRRRNGAVFSEIFPRFSLTKGATIFTMGSCFARNVEEKLPDFYLPTRKFGVPKNERLGRPNGILNEYNPGTMCQRVEFAQRRVSFEDLCIAPEKGGFIDLLLPEHTTAATKDRLMGRRREVDDVYGALFVSEAIIITFDLVEAWFDKVTKLYLNRIPPPAYLNSDRDRFEMHILDVEDSYALLERMVTGLLQIGIRKILLTISPVPLDVTYSGKDCFAANVYSKAVLTVCAQKLSHNFPQVDYFPGYEIVTSFGPQSYESDSIHVRDDIVEEVTAFMVEQYVHRNVEASSG
jgi:GSCFA family